MRAAIQETNALAGPQTIRFSSGITLTIVPATALPALTDDYTVIDASNEGYISNGFIIPGVTIDGASLNANGLTINASHCAIYGLHIINFDQAGIYVSGVAEGNHIGSRDKFMRNVITKNGHNGILIYGADAKNNIVTGNYIGTNVKGYYELNGGNGHHGVSVWYGMGNEITYNLIAANKWSGATMDAVDSGLIANNQIGKDISGGSLPNTFYGVHISNMAKSHIISNQIAFNQRGILVEGNSNAFISENGIYKNNATSLDVPEGGGVLITGTISRANLIQNHIYENSALYGGGVAVDGGAVGIVDQNFIQENEAVISTDGSVGGGGIYVESAYITVTNNTIISNTVSGPYGPTDFAYANGGGIMVGDNYPAWIIGNEILGNSVSGYAGNGGGVFVFNGGFVKIARNIITGNTVGPTGSGGGGIGISNSPAPQILIEANRVENNQTTSGGAVYINNSDYITLTNNLIVNNDDPGLYLIDNGPFIQSNFNTIAMNAGSGIVVNNAYLDIYNTLIISNSNYGIESPGSYHLSLTRNDVWGNVLGGSFLSSPLSFYLEVDPLFFGGDGFGAFALRPESPCIDVGDYGHPVSTSYNNAPRPIGAGYDLGAYEMSSPTFLPVLLR